MPRAASIDAGDAAQSDVGVEQDRRDAQHGERDGRGKESYLEDRHENEQRSENRTARTRLLRLTAMKDSRTLR